MCMRRFHYFLYLYLLTAAVVEGLVAEIHIALPVVLGDIVLAGPDVVTNMVHDRLVEIGHLVGGNTL